MDTNETNSNSVDAVVIAAAVLQVPEAKLRAALKAAETPKKVDGRAKECGGKCLAKSLDLVCRECAARLCGLTVKTLASYHSTGAGPKNVVRPGAPRHRRDDVAAWLTDQAA